MFKKLGLTVLVLGLMVGVAIAGGVQSDNSGNSGYIFVATGENHGKDSVGSWTDPSTLPELKGEKGDKGDVGPAGQDGLNGVDGQDGLDGAVGPQGETGATGETGSQGEQGIVGNDGLNGDDGINGENGKDVDPATVTNLTNMINQNTEGINNANDRITKLEDTQQIVGAEVRIHDSKKWTVTLFADFNIVRNTVDRQGIKFTYKMGESYTDKEMKRLETRIQALEVK
jgi:hypothetical protein